MELLILRGEPTKAESLLGYGSRYGSGSRSGDGSGSGSGYGDGSKEYWLSTVPYFVSKWSDDQQRRYSELKEAGATIAFWRSDGAGRACNGGSNQPVKPGAIETAPGPLRCRTKGVLHATFLPPKWEGSRWWIVALIGETVSEGDKVAALKREIIGECL